MQCYFFILLIQGEIRAKNENANGNTRTSGNQFLATTFGHILLHVEKMSTQSVLTCVVRRRFVHAPAVPFIDDEHVPRATSSCHLNCISSFSEPILLVNAPLFQCTEKPASFHISCNIRLVP